MDAAAISKSMSEVPAWHAIATDEVLRPLNTDSKKGLDNNEVAQRLSKYGPNRLPEGKRQGPFMRFLSQFNNILVYVLLAAGFVKLMVGLWLDAAIILGVVIIDALLGFIPEGKAEKALDSIRKMLSAPSAVLIPPLPKRERRSHSRPRGEQSWRLLVARRMRPAGRSGPADRALPRIAIDRNYGSGHDKPSSGPAGPRAGSSQSDS